MCLVSGGVARYWQSQENGTFTGPAGTFRQRTEITKAQRDILRALKIDVPHPIYQLTPAAEP